MPSISLRTILQLIVGLGLLNVWLLRPGSATPYRGGTAKTLKDEFAAYGLPDAVRYVVGALKVGAGVILIAGVWLPVPVRIAAGVVAALMIGAIGAHLKVGDAPMKSLPAVLMLLMCLTILVLGPA